MFNRDQKKGVDGGAQELDRDWLVDGAGGHPSYCTVVRVHFWIFDLVVLLIVSHHQYCTLMVVLYFEPSL